MSDDPPCGAEHPTEDRVRCVLPPGPNAHNEERGEDVHVHKGKKAGKVFRWEDA